MIRPIETPSTVTRPSESISTQPVSTMQAHSCRVKADNPRRAPLSRTVVAIKYAAAPARSASTAQSVSDSSLPAPPANRAIPVENTVPKASSGANSLLRLMNAISLNSQRSAPMAMVTAMYRKQSRGSRTA